MMGFFIASFISKYCGLPLGIIIGVLSIKILGTGLMASGLSGTVIQIYTGAFLLILLSISSNQGLLGKLKMRRAVAATANEKYEMLKHNISISQ